MEEYQGKNLVFVAGGIGLIPLRSCIVYALQHRDRYRQIQIYYGAKTPKELMYGENLLEWQKAPASRATSPWTRDRWLGGHVGVVGSLSSSPASGARGRHDRLCLRPSGHVPFRHPRFEGPRIPGPEHRIDFGALHEMRRRQVRALLHRRGLRLRRRSRVTYEQIHRLGEDI